MRVGQALFRTLPLTPLRAPGRGRPPGSRWTSRGSSLPGPLILSSMYYDLRVLRRAMALGFGAVTTKSITRGLRPGHPPPNLVR